VDLEQEALEVVAEKLLPLEKTKHDHVKLVCADILQVCQGREHIDDLADQDLVYSMNLMDCLSHTMALKLLNYMHSILKPGGKVVIGNFARSHPMVQHVLDGQLYPRKENDWNTLFRASKFGKPCTNIFRDPQDIQIYAECSK
jgi:extracellular factor (EF) 3-hydroxypalmitic acid methyl ester biosynthesis protein